MARVVIKLTSGNDDPTVGALLDVAAWPGPNPAFGEVFRNNTNGKLWYVTSVLTVVIPGAPPQIVYLVKVAEV